MIATARAAAEQRYAIARARQNLTTTARLDTLRAHRDVTSAHMWGFTTIYMVDAVYGADTAARIRAAHRAVPDDLPAIRKFWATVLPMSDAVRVAP